ncbi:MAG: ParB/RepB/Spo0J family partition protein [Acidimicrobiales bacterium]
MTEVGGSEVILRIPKDRVLLEPGFNARQIYRDIDKLAASIREVGQLEPCVVRAHPPDFTVVIGHRRRLAYDEPNMPNGVPCVVRAFPSRDDAMLAALASDPTSDPLRNYDLGERARYFVDKGMTVKQIAAVIGRDEYATGRILRCMRDLIPEVREAWSLAPSPEMEIPLRRLELWSRERPSMQLKLLRAYQAGSDEVETETGEKIRVNAATMKVRRSEMRAAITSLSTLAKNQPERAPYYEGAADALRWILGQRKALTSRDRAVPTDLLIRSSPKLRKAASPRSRTWWASRAKRFSAGRRADVSACTGNSSSTTSLSREVSIFCFPCRRPPI